MMEFQISFRNIEDPVIKEAIRNHIQKRLSGLQRYSRHIIDGVIVVEEERGLFSTQLTLYLKEKNVVAQFRDKDPYKTIDKVKEKIKEQLVKYEEKLKQSSRRRRGNEALGI